VALVHCLDGVSDMVVGGWCGNGQALGIGKRLWMVVVGVEG
jgi:hypothetical protein